MTSVSRYTPLEEYLHALSHAVGAVLGLIGLVLMLRLSLSDGDNWQLASAIVYGSSIILLYSSSALYHSIHSPQIKYRLRQLDHAAIFILIAGTYTPFTLISLRHDWGLILCAIIWTIALVGVVLELATGLKYKKLSLALYLGLGWIVVVAIKPMLANVPTEAMWLLLAGGLAYSGGVLFYIWRSLYLHHMLWHLFVLAGSILHFLAVYWYLMPQPA
ncbi:MAG: hemolysin III [Rheinheimera sp.]|uniref:PAQR family membrane homeostasis protein TrhA n=1 Tax=Arsukibacterium sp. UBA3155 TaxID=1946058 RepID=UPI000C933A39|nr:hemolysin III family protein [Arsukibacterium sp. UBA3155]MAD74601.1 hemolysin III [Rheinheimera sp.]|tara:strand:+ start:31325 stop:31975 length:651 start_codon:yes stop_codon:yes gene_type:complete